MGRKHKNASVRERPKLNVRGVTVKYQRLPNTVLDTSRFEIWQHAIGVGAALWCRSNRSLNVGVNHDPYGVWQACRFVLNGTTKPTAVDLSEEASYRVFRSIQDAWRLNARRRGFTEEMVDRTIRDLGVVPYAICCTWAIVIAIVGSPLAVEKELVFHLGDIRPVWLVSHRMARQYTSDLPQEFVLVDSGIQLTDPGVPVISVDASVDPHRYVSLASRPGCAAVVARNLNGLILGLAASDRVYQVVREGETRRMDILLPPPRLLQLSSDGSVSLSLPVAS